MPDFEATEVDGLQVVAANDPAFKALFGGLVVNETGVTESALGANLRTRIDADEPVIVLLHQPHSAAGYLGVDSLEDLNAGAGRTARPWDDGIPDLPPGSVNVGHLHDANRPWVVWNTDGDQVTWTVVSQLGTSGGVEENPTFNRFSTPFSVPLKTLSVQLQYFNTDSVCKPGTQPSTSPPTGPSPSPTESTSACPADSRAPSTRPTGHPDRVRGRHGGPGAASAPSVRITARVPSGSGNPTRERAHLRCWPPRVCNAATQPKFCGC